MDITAKTILKLFLGILSTLITIVLILILFQNLIPINELGILKWFPLLSCSIGFYIAGLINRETKLILTPILFISLIIFIPWGHFYFPFILIIILFSALGIILSRKELGSGFKIPSLVTLVCLLGFFVFSQPLILRNKDFGTDSAGNLYNATVLWDFTSKTSFSLPNEIFHDTNEKEISLKNFAGKTLFVTFWATWCGPCLHQKPELEKLKYMFQDNSDIVFIDISLDSNIERWKSFISENKPTGIQLVSQNDTKTRLNFQFSGIPYQIIADSESNFKYCLGPPFTDHQLLSNPDILNEYLNTPYKVFKITKINGKSNTTRVR